MGVTVSKWGESVPGKFKFTLKLSKTITHVKDLDFNPDDVKAFMQAASQIGNKKGCILIQFPPGLERQLTKLANLLAQIKSLDLPGEWTMVVEFRHSSWYAEVVYRLLESYNVCLVTHDKPGSTPPVDEYESDTIYLRFHGPGGNYRGSYEDDFLQEYARYITDWERQGKTVFVYFNNTMGDALKNLLTLNDYLREERI